MPPPPRSTGRSPRTCASSVVPSLICACSPRGRDAQVVVRLCDVAPDGTSTLVAMGARRVIGAAEQDAAVSMRATGYVVPTGHTLRLAVTPGYWPMVWPLSSGATLTIDRERCSARPSRGAAEGDDVVDRGARARAPTRARITGPMVFAGLRKRRGADGARHRLGRGAARRRLVVASRRNAPRGRRATTRSVDDDDDYATMERGRGDWRVRWNATSTMTADEECFHVASAT